MKELDIINCQGENCNENGCYSCGGYGHVLKKYSCICDKQYWSPGSSGYTVYEGKRWTSFDGLKMRESIEFGTLCESCYEGVGVE